MKIKDDTVVLTTKEFCNIYGCMMAAYDYMRSYGYDNDPARSFDRNAIKKLIKKLEKIYCKL